MELRKTIIVSYIILILVQILFLFFKYTSIDGIVNSETSMYLVLFPSIVMLVPIIFVGIVLYSLRNYKM